MSDIIGTKISQLPLGENLADDDLMLAVENGISKKVEVGYLKEVFDGGSDVSITPSIGSGTKVADYEIDGVAGAIYVPTAPTALSQLSDDSTHRTVTDTEKSTWNAKSDFSGSFNDLTDKPTIPSDADDISYDNTESGLTADDVQGAIDEVNGNIVDVEANPSGEATDELDKIKIGSTIYDIVGGGGGSEPVYGEASGAIANFSDGSANPLADLKIAINPVQAGSGDPSPSNPRPISGWTGANVYRTSINLLSPDNIQKGTISATGEVINSPNRLTQTNVIKVNNSGKYTINVNDNNFLINEIAEYGVTGNYLRSISPMQITYNFSAPSDCYYFRFTVRKSDNSNISPSDVGVMVANGEDVTYTAYNGTTYTISWQTEAGTVYGGELDVTGGVLKLNSFGFEGSDLSSISLASISGNLATFWIKLADNNYPNAVSSTTISSRFSRAIPSGAEGRMAATASDIYIVIDSTRLDTVDPTGMMKFFDDNPTQFYYTLNTPITYQLTPTQLSSILGVNNIWADSGDVDVVYIRDVNLFLNQLDARVKALENA